jgi:hypothetical protein
MFTSRITRFGTCLAMLFLFSHCLPGGSGGSAGSPSPGAGGVTSEGGTTSVSGGNGGSSGTASAGGSKDTGGTVAPGGTGGGSGATNTSGGVKGSGGTSSPGGTTGASGGASVLGGSKGSGGTTLSGGTGGGAGGTVSAGGTTSPGGTIGKGGATSTGGTTGAGGTAAQGGVNGTGGTSAAGTGGATTARTDCLGKSLAKPGESNSTSRGYLNLGDIRILNNRWGSDALGCSGTSMKVYVNSDSTVGYDFNRPTCGGAKGKPDYPEIEFGVAPFGANSSDLTSPACSSTALLPIQLSQMQSATLNFDNFSSTYQKPGYYDTNFEFWISKQNPLTSSSPGVYAEIIAFMGWDGIRMTSGSGWPCDQNKGSMTAGSSSWTLCHQKDGWGSGWRFFNFNLNNGPQNNFSGKVDVKAMLDWVMKNFSGFTSDMWLTRIEVGTEVDDNTQGTVKINNLTFEINGSSKSFEVAK